MTDLVILACIIVGLYIYQCVFWADVDAICFRESFLGARWHVRREGLVLAGIGLKGILANPFPPLSTLLVLQADNLAVSPEGIAVIRQENTNAIAFSEIRSINANGKWLIINGSKFAHIASEARALAFSKHLHRIAKLSGADREQAIIRELRFSLRGAVFGRWFRAFQRASATLRLLSMLLFFYLFVYVPILAFFIGIARFWMYALVVLLAFIVAICVTYYRLHSRIAFDNSDERWTHTVTILLSPFAAIRSVDALASEAPRQFHALAVAEALCTRTGFEEFASRLLRELNYPIPISGENLEQSIVEWFRSRFKTAVEAELRKVGFQPDCALGPPPRESSACLSFCPRCLSQYCWVSGTCPDCGFVPVHAFPD